MTVLHFILASVTGVDYLNYNRMRGLYFSIIISSPLFLHTHWSFVLIPTLSVPTSNSVISLV